MKNVCLYSAAWSFKTKQNLHTQHCLVKQFEHLEPRNLRILLAGVIGTEFSTLGLVE